MTAADARLREDVRRARRDLAQALADLAAMRRRAEAAEAALATMQASTLWQLTRPLRQVGGALPNGPRRVLGRATRVAWWSMTGQLPAKIRLRRRVQALLAAQGAEAPPDVFAPTLPDPGPRTEAVDIVVCVHDAPDDVRACLDAILRGTLPPYRVVLVDDGSGAETAALLDTAAREQGFTLLRHPDALGYTRAANAGLRASTAPWVVLINSDAIVSPGWLDRMWAHTARDPALGVIGPLSNTASWQSVPSVFHPGTQEWSDNPRPADVTIDDMGALARDVSVGAVPMPFLNGFCYMVRRSVLDTVGLFDEDTFGAGYGEENDYSIRVREAGHGLAVATDAYVHHAQSRSYSARRIELARRADELLMQKHEPARLIWPQAAQCKDSPALAAARARIAAGLEARTLRDEGRARFEGRHIAIILPIAERGGGGNVVLQESQALLRMGVDVTILNTADLQAQLGSPGELDGVPVRTLLNEAALIRHLADAADYYDAVIGTLYRSIPWLPFGSGVRLGYYVQDFEPWFFAADDPRHAEALASYTWSDEVRLVTKTRWNREQIERETGRLATVLGPSVATTLFAPPATPRAGPAVRVTAMVRPATPRRAPERTLRIFERVRAALGDRLEVTVFGATDAELTEAGLRRPWVRNAGRLDRHGLAGLLAKSDIFLDASDYQAMGLTALEAMLCGCAVVAPQHGGSGDFITSGLNGILVDSMDEAAAAEAVLRLADEAAPIRLEAIAEANRHIPERAALALAAALFDAQPDE